MPLNREAALAIFSSFPRIPNSTYRFQFHKDFPFANAIRDDLVDYLADLGISDVYSSPILKARPGSTHGYDVVDHSTINPDIGTAQDFEVISDAILSKGMGFLLDMVPNHVGIYDTGNRWWMDVLENGRSSQYASFLDIDWTKPGCQGKLLVPTLGFSLGKVIDNGELQVVFQPCHKNFAVKYYSQLFPLDPATYPYVLEKVLKRLKNDRKDDQDPTVQRLVSVIQLCKEVPCHSETDALKSGQRAGKVDEIKGLLGQSCAEDGALRDIIAEALIELNGNKETQSSFAILHELMTKQPYRLCYWKRASDEINYRRFFDINDLMAIRMENPLVYAEVHKLLFNYINEGRITGLRVDHPDGLYNPTAYFTKLQESCKQMILRANTVSSPTAARSIDKPLYLLIEKILEHGEELTTLFNVHGTTGYEYMNQLNGIFVDMDNESAFRSTYQALAKQACDKGSFDSLLYHCKKLIIDSSMESDISSLAIVLEAIASDRADMRDYSYKMFKRAISEVIACFPVYRTFITPETMGKVTEVDKNYIVQAVETAKKLEHGLDADLFTFLQNILLGPATSDKHVRFVMKFQQHTGPIMAKGLEDTVFYRFFLLTSLNEVGGNPDVFGISLEEFHKENNARAQKWPHTLLGTSTHDTKRSEDVRARINVLSELPEEWTQLVIRWMSINAQYKTSVSFGSHRVATCPEPNEEYFFYQTVLGAWPFGAQEATDEFIQRICNYMLKAAKEAKLHTSWTVPNGDYEKALSQFVCQVLSDKTFLSSFLPFQSKISEFGKYNSLSQTFVKLTSPGVPDVYQGTELWALSLVDPDNRRPVEYAIRKQYLKEIKDMVAANKDDMTGTISKLLTNSDNGMIKMFIIHTILSFRNKNPNLFSKGNYTALSVDGAKSKNIVAFMREARGEQLVAVCGRFYANLAGCTNRFVGSQTWQDTRVHLPTSSTASYRDILTGKVYTPTSSRTSISLAVSDIFSHLPMCLLHRVEKQ